MLVSCSRRATVEKILIDNLSPRYDINGRTVDAHGGCLQYFNGCYYLYGSRFGTNRVDSAWDCPFSVYSSTNLKDWTDRGNLLKDPPRGVYYRPYVVFNPKTRKYVLWFNWYQTLWKGNAGVALSDSPTGPFVIVNRRAHLAGSCPGDGSLFVDNDGTGYYIYTDIANDYAVRVEQLNADFTDSTGHGGPYIGFGSEAPLLFRRNDLYYVLVATLCEGCPQGSEVSVEISASPLGPYVFAGEINHQSGQDKAQASREAADFGGQDNTNGAGQLAGFVHPSPKKDPFIRGQETWVAQIPTWSEPLYIWMADGWYSAKDGMRGHDYQYWSSPLQFDTNGTIEPLTFSPRWVLVRAAETN